TPARWHRPRSPLWCGTRPSANGCARWPANSRAELKHRLVERRISEGCPALSRASSIFSDAYCPRSKPGSYEEKPRELFGRDSPFGDRRVEEATASGPLVLVDRALMLSRWQWHPHRQRCQPRGKARLAGKQLVVEFLDAFLQPQQRPGIGGP